MVLVLGMSLSAFTLLHVILSLAGIASGFVVVYGLFNNKQLNGWTTIFLSTTVLTSVTGFMFPFHAITPGIVLGVLSLIVLAATIAARYAFHFNGAWRSTYVISTIVALYFNCFVAVVQSFEKIPALKALAPTQKEPPFAIAQLVVLAIFVGIGIKAVRKFRIEPVAATRAARAS
jgi:hypothetical protein